MDIPTLKINANEFQNLIRYIYNHEDLLKEYGAIKIQLNVDCKLALKKRRLNLVSNPINEQIIKMNFNEGIYYVKEIDKMIKSNEKDLILSDKYDFWSSLSSSEMNRYLNVSLLNNKSLFSQRRSRQYFDIHRLPNQSLLKLGGTKVTRQFVPCLIRCHTRYSIIPLNCAREHLFSINYHHEGGNHHWYIIPNHQRDILEKFISLKDSSICLDHGKLLIDPLILDENQIKYYQIIQHPNEFIVFSSGSLTQCFTEDSSWSETTSFALPSWIEEGHANISNSLCKCYIKNKDFYQKLDLNLFRHELIKRFIISQLNINNHHQQLVTQKDYNHMDIITIPTPNSIETISSNQPVDRICPKLVPREECPIASCFESPSTSLISGSVESCFFEEEQIEYELLEEGTFEDRCDLNLINSISNEDLSERNEMYSNINENYRNNLSIDNYFLSFEELMDFFPSNQDQIISTSKQSEKNLNQNQLTKVSLNSTKKDFINKKVLFVSGLKNNINKRVLHNHFIGSTKIIIKQYKTNQNLKYAFICHRTFRQAERNLHQSIDLNLLGDQCHIEYSNSGKHLNNYFKRKLSIRRIPLNVNENDLNLLFLNSHLLKYSPATRIKNKILWGYAFILYDDEEEAMNIIKHSDQYKLNGQSLIISFYRN